MHACQLRPLQADRILRNSTLRVDKNRIRLRVIPASTTAEGPHKGRYRTQRQRCYAIRKRKRVSVLGMEGDHMLEYGNYPASKDNPACHLQMKRVYPQHYLFWYNFIGRLGIMDESLRITALVEQTESLERFEEIQ
ncbi:hypothetical protein CcaCcLH18_13961 [Colletotrichum camelliae]|nr:hypothetical protein CcaCcLH18_13961 [Colletotrichum camelliae]